MSRWGSWEGDKEKEEGEVRRGSWRGRRTEKKKRRTGDTLNEDNFTKILIL
jgi:hypothetical protein